MMELFLDLLGLVVFEFSDYVTEQKIRKNARYRHFHFWGGWISYVLILAVTAIVGIVVATIFAICLRDGDFGLMFFLGIFLAGVTLFSGWCFCRNFRTMVRLIRVYFQ